jgi:putative isomerase
MHRLCRHDLLMPPRFMSIPWRPHGRASSLKASPAAGLCWLLALLFPPGTAAQAPRSPEYETVQRSLAQGWNTWDVYSVASQALLPEGFALRVGLKHNSTLYADAFLPDVQVGLRGKDEEDVFPGPHTWNGSYTELRFTWRGHEVLLQTAHDGEDLVMLATPGASKTSVLPTLVISTGILWNRPGGAARSGNHIEFSNGSRRIPVYWTGAEDAPASLPLATPYFAAPFENPIGVSTGSPRSVEEIRAILDRQRPRENAVPQAIETVMGWDTIYDPSQSRVISPVSRLWSTGWGGYVLFEWDTFFAASLAASGNRELSYANAMEILREAGPVGPGPQLRPPGRLEELRPVRVPRGRHHGAQHLQEVPRHMVPAGHVRAASALESLVEPASRAGRVPRPRFRRIEQAA